MVVSLIHHFLFFFFFFTIQLSNAQVNPNAPLLIITAGSNPPLLSPSGDFAFGFYPISDNDGPYLLGVWFNKIPEKTLVWSANRDDPADTGSTIQLTTEGQLVLYYSNNSIQNIYLGPRMSARTAIMQDDGNFVLRDSNSLVIWQSFDSPTDTLLPGQVLFQNTKLYSKANGIRNYSTGSFMLEMKNDGNLVLSAYRFSDQRYWYMRALMNNVSLVFNNNSAHLYLVNGNNGTIRTLNSDVPTPVGDFYHRATISEYGNFEQFVYRKSNGSVWQRVWRALAEPCLVSSVCGVYGFCSSSDNETVSCKCLPGYIPLDRSAPSKGCQPKIVVNYYNDAEMTNFTVQVIEDADFPLEGFGDLGSVLNVDVEGCKTALMKDDYSMAAALRGSTCNKKRMPLLNARKTASTKGRMALIKVPKKVDDNASSQKGDRKNSSKTRDQLKAGLYTSSILAFLFGLLAVYYHPATRKLVTRKSRNDTTMIGTTFREFTYQELREATNGFIETLGQGSSGKVFSGTLCLKDVRIGIAVKKLGKLSERAEREFITKLKIIGRTHHRNLVRLLGFCIEDNQHLLVYELMKNGTLYDFLFKDPAERPSWTLRSEMAIGIAKGLLYLHEECETQIIHSDINPQTVLIADNYIAKLTDFGLSNLQHNDTSLTYTKARENIGYKAPEWLNNGPVTVMADVYSFGVMLLEICSAKPHIGLNRVEEESEAEDLHLIDWVLACMRSGRLDIVARHDAEVLSNFNWIEMVRVGVWCVHPDPFMRPSMKKVTQMLEGTIEVGIPPLMHQD